MEDSTTTIKNSQTATTFSSSAASNTRKDPTMAQYNADARLLAEFEQTGESGMSFHYTKSVTGAPLNASEEQISAYLSKIQRGGLIQPFGCMLAIEESSFRIICYSENCFEMLGLAKLTESPDFAGLFGVDVRALFTPSSRDYIMNAVLSPEISLLNPIWIHSVNTRRPFCAILHRIDVGVVIDLEPTITSDPAFLLAGAVHSQKLAVRAISRLQALPGGDIGVLCDTVVEDVQKLTGYDRVMVYKFHEDEHGEVVSEIRRSNLESYLGLHYPATDIPQAARFLFKQNRVRIICDCNANPVRVIQIEEMERPLCLVNSTLRAPHGCHMQYMGNMGSVASLVMAVVINGNNSMKLWGLVVCHHSLPRHVPYPLRHACQFLMQAFGLQLNMELQLAAQLTEKKILRMQTLLCDMLLRDNPLGIVNQSPNIMDLVKCDGAAMYYGEKCWLLGITPTESQVKDIAEWLLINHADSTGLTTDCLANTRYHGAALLGDAVCGLATARINSRDFLFWFRSHTAKEIKWGGAKHDQEDRDDDDKMNPRASFRAFLEVAKSRSLPWDAAEINAIHSLQLILRNSIQLIDDNSNNNRQINDTEMQEMGELNSVACEMVRLIETATAPIFGVDLSGLVNGWNSKMAQLTGLEASEAMGKSFVDEVVHENSCREVENLLYKASQGEEDKNVELKLRKFGSNEQDSVIYIVANTCTSRDRENNVIGVCFVGQDITCEKIVMDKFIRLQEDYKAIIQSVNPMIPPIFASDENACCSEWNPAMEKLTGWMRYEVIGKMLPKEVFGGFCRVKDQDSLTKFMILLYRAISGHDTAKIAFGFFDREGKFVEVLLTANKRTVEGRKVSGCFCFLQTPAPDLQLSLGERKEEKEWVSMAKELAYIRQEIKNPLNGIRFTHKLLESTAISDNQKQYLETSNACERQIMSIIEDMDLESIEDGNVELKVEEFLLENLTDAILSQVMTALKEKDLQMLQEIPAQIKKLTLYGDQIRLQLVLSNLLLNIVHYAPSPNGWVEIKVDPRLSLIQDGNEFVHLQFRMTHPGQGLTAAVIEDMFGEGNEWTTSEGVALNLSRKLLSKMNGHVDYVREENKCYFLVNLELKTRK